MDMSVEVACNVVFMLFTALNSQVEIYSLSRSWKDLVDKARAKQLSPAEYSSGLNSALHGLTWILLRKVWQNVTS